MKRIPINTKEKSDKLLLSVEIVLGIFSTILLVGSILVAALCFMSIVPAILIISAGVICFVVGMFMCLKIEQLAGYYECPRCDYRYIPKFKDVCFSLHFGRTRKLTCPKCERKSWHEKVLREKD